MLTNDLHPPGTGLNSDPILYGVAAGLAELFPPVASPRPPRVERGGETVGIEPDESASD